MNVSKLISLFACSLLIHINMNAQTQKGADINGEAMNDESGRSVSMPDANTIAIGSYLNDDNGTDAGQVRIYQWDGNTWTQKGSDINGEAAGDQSGWSVSMPDANTIAIGADRNGGNGFYSGHVRIYNWNGNAWVQKGNDLDGEASTNSFGYAVSMPDENTVAIGAPFNSGVNGFSAGEVSVYQWDGNAWVQKGADIPGKASQDQSGWSVSMPDANTIAIGAVQPPGAINNGGNGQVSIYQWSGTAWIQKGADLDGEALTNLFGNSVSMPNENTVAVGAPLNNGTAGSFSGAGHVRIFNWSGNAWQQKGNDIDGNVSQGSLGFAVSMSDENTIAIGAPGNGSNRGQVRIYQWNGTTWIRKGSNINGEAIDDNSGVTVSMPDENTVAIGAFRNDGNGSNSGHARIYEICNLDTISDVQVACNSYIWIDGNTYTASTDTAVQILTTTSGCDSIVKLDLTINSVSNVSATASGSTATADNPNGTYQWIDCDNSFSPIVGATNISYTTSKDGDYAVIITENGCVDTTDCVILIANALGLESPESVNLFNLYPNPTHELFTIEFDAVQTVVEVTVSNVTGQLIHQQKFQNQSLLELAIQQLAGIYFVTVKTPQENQTVRVMIN